MHCLHVRTPSALDSHLTTLMTTHKISYIHIFPPSINGTPHQIMVTPLLLCVILGVVSSHQSELPPSFLGLIRTHREPVSHDEDSNTDLRSTGAVLTASPNEFIDTGEDITVEWINVPAPDSYDWIGMYCGRESGVSPNNVLDWMYVNDLSTNGSVIFRNLINMRCKYFFRYYRDISSGEYALIAESNEISPIKGTNTPMHGRLSLTDNLDEMQVTWTSNSQLQTFQEVRYSKDCVEFPTAFVTAVNHSAPTTYNAEDMCGSPANVTYQYLYRPVGYFHTVLLADLAPDTLYCYQYGNAIDGFSDVFSFRTPGGVGKEIGVKFVAYGDMGVSASNGATSTALRVSQELGDTDFLLHFGDISYARGYGYIWEQFHYMIEPLSTRLPYMVSVGNHEYDHISGGWKDPSNATGTGFHPAWGNYGDDSSGECSVPVYHRFRSPSNGKGVYWYSFDYGNIHVVQISSEHDYTYDSEQWKWLDRDLGATDRTITPFIVVTSHRPMYNSENYASDYEVSLHLREALEPLLDIYKVDVFLAGHYHSYERTCSVYNEECFELSDVRGTVHITVGSAGASLDSAAWMNKPWHSYGAYEFGYLRVSTNEVAMTLQYVRNEDGSVADSITLPSRF